MRLEQLESEFKKIKLPSRVRIKSGVWIVDVPKFIEVNIICLKANSGNKRYMTYYNQLIELYKKIK